MGAIRVPVGRLPSDWSLEVWGDSMVWIVSPDGRERVLLREFLGRDSWTRSQNVDAPMSAEPDDLIGQMKMAAMAQGFGLHVGEFTLRDGSNTMFYMEPRDPGRISRILSTMLNPQGWPPRSSDPEV